MADVAALPSRADDQPAPVVPKTRTIVVDGQRIEVDESKIFEAGVKTLQKETAADKRLQEANLLLQRAKQGHAAQSVETEQSAPNPQPSHLDQEALMDVVGKLVQREVYGTEADRAADLFVNEYPEIASDPFLAKIAHDLEDQRLAHALSVGEPFGNPAAAYRKHGEAIRSWLKAKAPAPTSAPAAPAVDTSKQERKREITVVQSASARAPNPNAQEKPQTVDEVIEGMRRARQGRPILTAHR